MEKDKNKNEGLQSRREFFKSAAKAALPIIGATILASAPNILCAAETELDGEANGCDWGCSGSCWSSCQSSCRNTCSSGCTGTCSGGCKARCSNSCASGAWS